LSKIDTLIESVVCLGGKSVEDKVMNSSGLRNHVLYLIVTWKSCICALVLVLLLAPITASAQRKSSATNLTASDLEPWLDGFMANALRVNEVQGAVVVVIKNGKVLVEKGYGYTDAATRTPVDPVNSMFRPGSISKLFVWTSIMQLVEQGKIDLDADINTYLDFKIVGMGGKKITIRQLMTHRGGFEEIGKSGIFNDPALLKPLKSEIKDYIPQRIFAPGSTPAYSNYGTALAGYIVQRVSGMAFETYVERNIFAPLEMAHSTFRQPLPKALQPFMSKGYQITGDHPQPFELTNQVPAGALSASTGDIAKFMVAHLEAEHDLGGKLLKPETARLMHRSLIKNFPNLNGMALGFYQKNRNGHTIIGHGGDLNLFHSDLSLFIDDDIGIYISMNSAGNNTFDIRSKLLDDFSDRYMPATTFSGKIDTGLAKEHLAHVKGAYVPTRRLVSSFLRLIDLFSEVSISTDSTGLLVLNSFSKQTRFREIRPYLWQEVDGKESLAVTVKDGRPLAMSINSAAPVIEFTTVMPLASASIVLPAFVASFLVLIISIIAWPFGVVARKLYGTGSNESADQRRLFLTRQTASIALVISGSVWVILIAAGLSSGFTDALNIQILLTQAISILCVLISAVGILMIIRGLLTVKQSRIQTLGAALWLVAAIFVIWFHYSYNLLKLGANF
jgi:CubicO group peptidase (beta-lactamase class C family)